MGYAELEALVRAQLPKHTPYVVLGESFSGPIAASLAGAPPSGMLGAILCCSFLRNPQPRLTAVGGMLRFAPLKLTPVHALAPVLLGRYSTLALCSALARALGQVSSGVLRARLRAVLEVDVRLHLARAKVPVLYLQADKDRVVPARAAAEVKANLPSATVVVLAGPHLLLQANPADALKVIKHFLLGLPSAGPQA
jgi:pimeloyl-ACP methyl ester carboxylesterase